MRGAPTSARRDGTRALAQPPPFAQTGQRAWRRARPLGRHRSGSQASALRLSRAVSQSPSASRAPEPGWLEARSSPRRPLGAGRAVGGRAVECEYRRPGCRRVPCACRDGHGRRWRENAPREQHAHNSRAGARARCTARAGSPAQARPHGLAREGSRRTIRSCAHRRRPTRRSSASGPRSCAEQPSRGATLTRAHTARSRRRSCARELDGCSTRPRGLEADELCRADPPTLATSFGGRAVCRVHVRRETVDDRREGEHDGEQGAHGRDNERRHVETPNDPRVKVARRHRAPVRGEAAQRMALSFDPLGVLGGGPQDEPHSPPAPTVRARSSEAEQLGAVPSPSACTAGAVSFAV